PVLEQVRREGMAQTMGRQPGPDARLAAVFLDQLPEALARHSTAPGGQEERPGCLSIEPGAGFFEVAPEPVSGRPPERNQPLASPFSRHAENLSGQIDGRAEVRLDLGATQDRSVEEPGHGSMPQPECG